MEYTQNLKRLKISKDIAQDVYNIVNGAYAPLVGFLRERDFQSVLDNMRLESGELWSMPIVLDINAEARERLKNETEVVLVDEQGNPVATLNNIEIYPYKKGEFARKVFGTEDLKHPGVREVMDMGEYLIGGDIKYNVNITDVIASDFIQAGKRVNLAKYANRDCFVAGASCNDNANSRYNYTPKETKQIFKEKGWNTIVAFQTRNVPHRSHEFLQKKALEKVDGLLIHPVIGKKKAGDFKDKVILESYKMLLDNYYPKERSLLSALPIRMRYAGPREAVMHALIRRNYGCTHMIIGRDHAGVGNYYGSYDAHNIFDEFGRDELGIKILKYENVSFCELCGDLKIDKTCGHSDKDKLFLSGTKIREMIKNKEILPKELIRPEVSEILLNHPNPFVE